MVALSSITKVRAKALGLNKIYCKIMQIMRIFDKTRIINMVYSSVQLGCHSRK